MCTRVWEIMLNCASFDPFSTSSSFRTQLIFWLAIWSGGNFWVSGCLPSFLFSATDRRQINCSRFMVNFPLPPTSSLPKSEWQARGKEVTDSGTHPNYSEVHVSRQNNWVYPAVSLHTTHSGAWHMFHSRVRDGKGQHSDCQIMNYQSHMAEVQRVS